MNLLLFKMQLTNKCSALLGKLRRYPYGYRLVYFGLIIFIYFLLRFVRMIIATTAAARIIPITTRIIPIIPLNTKNLVDLTRLCGWHWKCCAGF